jgi:EAL domain-containing protein (putative c-di-GMP-specific phosphodiesterase class I)
MGVSIAFDDFGTGYASLSCLTSFPLTHIKIDRSFVQRASIDSAPEHPAIVRSILALARNLNLDGTAEGVETPAQATFLRSENCQELQGYLSRSLCLPTRSNRCCLLTAQGMHEVHERCSFFGEFSSEYQ